MATKASKYFKAAAAVLVALMVVFPSPSFSKDKIQKYDDLPSNITILPNAGGSAGTIYIDASGNVHGGGTNASSGIVTTQAGQQTALQNQANEYLGTLQKQIDAVMQQQPQTPQQPVIQAPAAPRERDAW